MLSKLPKLTELLLPSHGDRGVCDALEFPLDDDGWASARGKQKNNGKISSIDFGIGTPERLIAVQESHRTFLSFIVDRTKTLLDIGNH